MAMTGYCRHSLVRKSKDGSFPKPQGRTRVNTRMMNYYDKKEIDSWLESNPAKASMLLRNRDPMVVSKFNKAQMRSIREAAKALELATSTPSPTRRSCSRPALCSTALQKRRSSTLPEHDPELLAMVRNAQATWANADIELPARFSTKEPPRRQVQKHRRRTRDKKTLCQQITRLRLLLESWWCD